MKYEKQNQTDELMDSLNGVRKEYLEEADQVFLHGKKGQRRRRTAVLLAAAAVFIAAVGIGIVLIIRNNTKKPDVSTDLSSQQENSTETPTESTADDKQAEAALDEARKAVEAAEKL